MLKRARPLSSVAAAPCSAANAPLAPFHSTWPLLTNARLRAKRSLGHCRTFRMKARCEKTHRAFFVCRIGPLADNVRRRPSATQSASRDSRPGPRVDAAPLARRVAPGVLVARGRQPGGHHRRSARRTALSARSAPGRPGFPGVAGRPAHRASGVYVVEHHPPATAAGRSVPQGARDPGCQCGLDLCRSAAGRATPEAHSTPAVEGLGTQRTRTAGEVSAAGR